MRRVALLLVGLSSLLLTASDSRAKCGDRPRDDQNVGAVLEQIAEQCECCSSLTKRTYVACAASVVQAAVDAGSLRRRCARPVIRQARRSCRPRGPECSAGGCFDTLGLVCTGEPCGPNDPCPAFNVFCTPECAPSSECSSGRDCDDGNPCTLDQCAGGDCQNECQCVGPGGGGACCPGPSAGGSYFFTCGDPVCGGSRDNGVPACSTQQEGDPCCSLGETCDPGDRCNRLLICATSDPTGGGSCPISRRRYKEDIEYVSDAGLRRLHDELLGFKLATYRYKAPLDSSASRLGFIIDDVEGTPAVDSGGERVDLYAYTSMAVAALQTQAREIEGLKREIAELKECAAGESGADERPVVSGD